MPGDVPPGIDVQPVTSWFFANVPGSADGGPLSFTLIGDGRSNLTYRVENSAGSWVLRRPPLGHVVATAHDMAREHAVLSGVALAGFPAPRPIALCEDPSVLGVPFYVMEFVDGVIVVSRVPNTLAPSALERRKVGTALVDTLVRLHAIDYDAVGLGSFGRPEGYLERQVRRWSSQWEANKTRELPAIEELIRRLNHAIPASPAPTIVHGDYRLGNMLLKREDAGTIAAVLDWEMSTLGDPLADLGYTLVYWGEENDNRPPTIRQYSSATSLAGFHTRSEIVAEYAAKSGRDVAAIEFYVVFAFYKLAVITEGIYRRFVEGKAIGEGLDQYAESSVELANYALELAGQSQLSALRGP